jgi:hypothetical protein
MVYTLYDMYSGKDGCVDMFAELGKSCDGITISHIYKNNYINLFICLLDRYNK